MEINFHGLKVLQGTDLHVVGGSELLKLQIESKVRLESWAPSVSFGELLFICLGVSQQLKILYI